MSTSSEAVAPEQAVQQPLGHDFAGTLTVTLSPPTGNGYEQVVLRPNEIDEHAQALYGYHSCHYLASAINCMTTGWSMVTLTGTPPGHDTDKHVHTASEAPDGRVLDIFGISPNVHAWRADWERRVPFPLQFHRGLRSQDVHDLVKNPGSPPAGRWWWTRGAVALTAAHQHFARALLRTHGYDNHLLPEAHSTTHTEQPSPAPASTSRPQPGPSTPSTARTNPGGTAMTGIDEILAACLATSDKTRSAIAAIQQATVEISEIQALMATVASSGNAEIQEAIGTFHRVFTDLEQSQVGLGHAADNVEAYRTRL